MEGVGSETSQGDVWPESWSLSCVWTQVIHHLYFCFSDGWRWSSYNCLLFLCISLFELCTCPPREKKITEEDISKFLFELYCRKGFWSTEGQSAWPVLAQRKWSIDQKSILAFTIASGLTPCSLLSCQQLTRTLDHCSHCFYILWKKLLLNL